MANVTTQKKPLFGAQPLSPALPASAASPRETALTPQAATAPTAPVLDAPPSETEVRSILDQIRSAKRETATPASYEMYQQAEDRAKELYESKANRDEWLSLAEKIGQSLIRLNAANQGLKHGVDLSGVNLGPGVDWESRANRYGRELDRELQQAKEGRVGARQLSQDEQRRLDTDYEDRLAALNKQYDFAKSKYGQEVSAAEQQRREESMAERADRSARERESAADRRAREADARAARRDEQQQSAFETRENLKQLSAEERDAQKQLEARQTLINQLQREDDFSNRGKERLRSKYGELAGKAGLDLDSLMTNLEEQETLLPSWLGGKSAEAEKQAKKEILGSKISETRNMLDALRKRRQALIGGQKEGAPRTEELPSSLSSSTQEPTAKGTLSQEDLAAYAAQHFNGNIAGAKKFLEDQGYAIK